MDERGRLKVYTDASCSRPPLEEFWVDEVVLPGISLWARIKKNRLFKTVVTLVTGVAQALILALLFMDGLEPGSPLLVALVGVVLGLAALLEGLINLLEGRDRERLMDEALRLHGLLLESSPGYRYAYKVVESIVAAAVEAYCRGSPLLVYDTVVVLGQGRQGRFQVIKPRV